MKNGKKLTRQMRQELARYDKTLKLDEWLYTKASYDNLEIINKNTNEVRNYRR